MGEKMRCEVILRRNVMRGEITEYYFYRTLSIYYCDCHNRVKYLEFVLDLNKVNLSLLMTAFHGHKGLQISLISRIPTFLIAYYGCISWNYFDH